MDSMRNRDQPRLIKTKGAGLLLQAAIWDGGKKTILALHGLTANCRCWDLLASVLTPLHRLVAPDLRGRGHSDQPASGYSLADHVEDLVLLMDDLRLESPVVMGHSLGAFIALSLAATHPERVERIILLDGGGELSETQRAKVFLGIKPSLDRLGRVFPDRESFRSSLQQIPFFRPWNEFHDRYSQYDFEEVEGGLCSRVKAEHIREEMLNLRSILPSRFYPLIRGPVLILRALSGMMTEDDLVLPEEVVDRMVREIPRVRRVDLEGTNHYSILFQPNSTRDRVILQFLDS